MPLTHEAYEMIVKKSLTVSVILLFIGMSVIPSTGTVVDNKSTRATFYDGNTLYVGGLGPGNYTTIQAAINNASNGDTVFVYNGTYFENIVVNKTINLIGENKNTTIIDGGGSGDVVSVTADWVNVSDFTIQNGGGYGIYLFNIFNLRINNNDCSNILIEESGNHIISNNTFSSIYLDGSSNNKITDNNCDYIEIWGSSNNFITSNNCSNGTGIFHWYSSYNVIKNNIISGNNGQGIDVEESEYNIISNNTFIGNSEDGIHLADYCAFNTITNNICNENGGNGINRCNLCKKSYSMANQNIIENNTCNNNNGNGINVDMAHGDSFINNSCRNNKDGIYLHDSENNVFSGNTITSNNHNGIIFSWECNNNIVSGNNITNNNEGIYLYDSSNNNLIYHNNLINNTQNAYDEGSNTWYNSTLLEGNFWDDYTGVDDDGDGIGDTPYNISGGSNQDLYPLMHHFELYYILNISAPSQVDEGTVFNVTIKSMGGKVIPNAIVEFNDEIKLTDMNGMVQFTAPQVGADTYYDIIVTKERYTGDIKQILVKDVPVEFVSTFIFGRITNLNTLGQYITFEAVNIRCITFFPFTFNAYTSGELITISKDYFGFIGANFIFALCGASIGL